MSLPSSVPSQLRITDYLVENHSDGAYAVLRFRVEGWRESAALEVCYGAFFDIDPSHRGLARMEDGPGAPQLAVFSPEHKVHRFELNAAGSSRAPTAFVKEGIWHIWTGYDHLLFLLALLLPGVLRRQDGAWRPQEQGRDVLSEVLRTVTAFTLAHSITLTLAALGWVHLPSRLVECTIAASVILAAANNVTPFFAGRGWLVAFAFGLVHGFGFASALTDLGLHTSALAPALFGFNAGVELGQLAVVAMFLPVALALRYKPAYRRCLLPLGSVAIAVLATIWFTERAFDVRWLPF